MLKINELTFAYQDSDPLFVGLNQKISTTGITLLCGANGSGKTTFCRILSGLEKKCKGKILIDDLEIGKSSVSDISQQMIYLKQEPMANVVATTPREDLDIWLNRFSSKQDNNKLIEEALAKVSMSNQIDSHIWELSSGQIKRVGLAAVSLFPQKYWILDEPTSGLDANLINTFIEMLKERTKQGLGTLIVTHRLELFREMNPTIIQIREKDLIEI